MYKTGLKKQAKSTQSTTDQEMSSGMSGLTMSQQDLSKEISQFQEVCGTPSNPVCVADPKTLTITSSLPLKPLYRALKTFATSTEVDQEMPILVDLQLRTTPSQVSKWNKENETSIFEDLLHLENSVDETFDVFVKGFCALMKLRMNAGCTLSDLQTQILIRTGLSVDDFFVKIHHKIVSDPKQVLIPDDGYLNVQLCFRGLGGAKDNNNNKKGKEEKKIERKVEKKVKKEIKKDKMRPSNKMDEKKMLRRAKDTLIKKTEMGKGTQFKFIAELLCKMITFPYAKDTRMLALQTGAEATKTALFKAKQIFDMEINNTPDEENVFNWFKGNSQLILLFRDPVHFCLFWLPNIAEATYDYQLMFIDASDEADYTSQLEQVNTVDWKEAAPAYLQWITGIQPHGEICPVGVHVGDYGYILLQRGNFISVVYTGTGVTGISIKLTHIFAKQKLELPAVTISASGGFIPITETGYYKMYLRAAGANPTSVSITFGYNAATIANVNSGVMCLTMLPDFDAECPRMDSMRINGAALCWTPTGDKTTRGGFEVVRQYEKTRLWNEIFDRTANLVDPLSIISTENDIEPIGAEKGAYAWLKPTSEDSFSFKSSWGTNPSANSKTYHYPVVPEDGFLVLAMTVNQSTLSTPSAKLTVGACGEYTTKSQYRERGAARIPEQMFRTVVDHVSTIVQFTENPTHLEKISSSIRNVVSGIANEVIKWAPVVSGIAQTIKMFL